MRPQDWPLINNYDTGKLAWQKDGSWTAADSKSVVKWKVIPRKDGYLEMAASKDIRGFDNVISVILSDLQGTQTPFNFYITAGQICRNKEVKAYAAAIKQGHLISGISHYQRFKVLPKPKKGGPPP